MFGYSGFSELKLEPNLLRIALVIPGHARKKRARQMMFLYAAERTLESGYQKFVFIENRKIPKSLYWSKTLSSQILLGKYGTGLSDPSQVHLKVNFSFVGGYGSANRSSAGFVLMLTNSQKTDLVMHSAKKITSELKPLVMKHNPGQT